MCASREKETGAHQVVVGASERKGYFTMLPCRGRGTAKPVLSAGHQDGKFLETVTRVTESLSAHMQAYTHPHKYTNDFEEPRLQEGDILKDH